MKKPLQLLLGVLVVTTAMSCTDVNVYPTTTTAIYLADTVFVDPDVEKFAQFMTAHWRVPRASFDANLNVWILIEEIDCNAEKQFAFLEEMEITRTTNPTVLKVVNTYVCVPSQTTYFTLSKMACCGFMITEKDDRDRVLRVFDFVTPNGQSLWNDVLFGETGYLGISLYARTYDPTTFDLDSPGSLTELPAKYSIFIEKNF